MVCVIHNQPLRFCQNAGHEFQRIHNVAADFAQRATVALGSLITSLRMFSALVHKELASAEGYFVEHLAQNDYYAAGEIRPGQ